MNRAASRLRNPNGLPANIEGIGAPNGEVADPNDAKKASDQWNRRLEMYDKQLKMGAEVERIENERFRHLEEAGLVKATERTA